MRARVMAVRHLSSAFHINAEAAAKSTKELRARRLSAALTTTHPFIMASPESSSGEEPKKNLEQITFRFCSEW
jgi:hypothetical protein